MHLGACKLSVAHMFLCFVLFLVSHLRHDPFTLVDTTDIVSHISQFLFYNHTDPKINSIWG